MYRSIEEIKKANAAAGRHFFNKDSKEFFNSTIYPTIYHGRYFITSEYYDDDSPIAYAVREAHADGSVTTVSGYQEHLTFESAERAVKALGR